MIYARKMILPDEGAEVGVILGEKRTYINTVYPFKIFPPKLLREIEFDGITLFYGGNGSGKSTLINVIARKMGAIRYSDFNDAPLFEKYIQMCRMEYFRQPQKSYVLTSDDVFDYVLSARAVNENIDDRRNDLVEKYVRTHREAVLNPEIGRLKSLDDYQRWQETVEILSPKRTQSSFVRGRVERDVDLRSNGETAMRYFVDRIEENAVYFLDEPENSLSIEFQIQLAEYIAAMTRTSRSQFIIATHSPIFLSMKDAKIYNLDDYPAAPCVWTELPNVRKYFKFFMEHRDEFE